MHIIDREESDITVRLDFTAPDEALTVEREGRTVLSPSPIGLSMPDGSFPADHEFIGRETVPLEETIHTAHGSRRIHDHHATVAKFEFESAEGRTVIFEVRVTDDGVAYRYRVGGNGVINLFGSRPQFGADDSAFELPVDAVGWLFEYGVDHESVGRHYSAHRANGEFSMPGLFRTGEDWVLIGEAGVDGDFAASRLATAEASTRFEYRMPRTTVFTHCPTATPWRMALIGDFTTVASSSLPKQLVATSGAVDGPGGDHGARRVDPDADWVRPGRVAWSWWSDMSSPGDGDIQRRYIDYAAERGWEHVLLDMGWNPDDVPALVEYAHERDVGVFLWSHWTDLHRAEDRQRRLDRWAEWGIDGVKIDFMDNDDQGRHQFYDEVIDAAAERELMLNFHGAVVPTGLSGRSPHVMTYEGVMGAEHYSGKGLPPEHNTILAVTRNVVGPMDYTPVTFTTDNRRTSTGHELALSVVFESGLQHFADSREAYSARPHAEWFLERVPAAWDETVFLDGWPGTSVSVARMRDGDWFVGTITAGPARTVDVDLSMVAEQREAVLVRDAGPTGETVTADGDGRDALTRESLSVDPGETLSVDVAENGGFCAYLPE
jgi:hypothetical protein